MLTGYYDLAKCPPTYDFVSFLLALEQYRLRRGEKSVEIELQPGPAEGFRDDNLWPPTGARRELLDRIIFPMAGMLPSCTKCVLNGFRVPRLEPCFGYGKYSMEFKNFVRAIGNGIRPLRPTTGHLPYDSSLVTLTLRECEHWPKRNSRVDEWQKAAGAIQSMGYRARIVRDARIEPIDLEARANLYRSAACNMFVSNGPAWFAMALDAPVVIMRPATEGTHRLAGAANLKSNGIPIGGQIPGAPSHQRLVWEDDTTGNIVDACRAFMDDRKQQAA